MTREVHPTGPYVKLSLLPELMGEDDDGFVHIPLAIESWPPGLNVLRLLRHAVEILENEGGDEDG